MNCPDNYDVYIRHETEQEKQLENLPICEYCSKPIQNDFLWDIEGTLFHEHCAELQFRKDADGYVS